MWLSSLRFAGPWETTWWFVISPPISHTKGEKISQRLWPVMLGEVFYSSERVTHPDDIVDTFGARELDIVNNRLG